MAFIFKKKSVSGTSGIQCSNDITPGKEAEIYVGIDFGTTFTKVSFQVGAREGATKYSLRYSMSSSEDAYCLPSKLGYARSTDELVFAQEHLQDGVDEVKYFKYSMIEKGVPRHRNLDQRPALKNDPQRLCSAFYLAHLLRDIKTRVQEHQSVKGRYQCLRWYVNMGVPVSDFNAKPKPVYDEALNVAWHLAEDDTLSDRMALDRVDSLYCKWLDRSQWSGRLNTVPELYAEIIMFLQDKSVDTGFYSVIDIGGGTVDLAVFFKRIDLYTQRVEISCVAQDVCPLGYEIYRNVLSEECAVKRMRRSYGTLMDAAYHHQRNEMMRVQQNGGHLVHFYMGGARSVPFYHNVVEGMVGVHQSSWSCYPGAKDGDMVAFMRGKGNLEVDDNTRLLISQMLAQPFELIPELSGKPWNFNKRPVYIGAPTLAELQDSLYGEG